MQFQANRKRTYLPGLWLNSETFHRPIQVEQVTLKLAKENDRNSLLYLEQNSHDLHLYCVTALRSFRLLNKSKELPQCMCLSV
jgi:hypothetical protein